MTLNEFKASLSAAAPPPALDAALQALWYDARGDWEQAHRCVQDDESLDAAWVHAYLHRKEGDLGNAGYWYRRAGRPQARDPLSDEWDTITATLLQR